MLWEHLKVVLFPGENQTEWYNRMDRRPSNIADLYRATFQGAIFGLVLLLDNIDRTLYSPPHRQLRSVTETEFS